MGKKQRLGRLIAALVAIMVLGVVGASPASAGTDIVDGVCDGNEVCMYRNNWGGYIADPNECEGGYSTCGLGRLDTYDYYNTSTSPNDRTSSIWNRLTGSGYGNVRSDQYQHSYLSGNWMVTCGGVQYSQSVLQAVSMHDNISSFTNHTDWQGYC